MPDILIDVVPALKDNYCYLISRAGSTRALAVDPSEDVPIFRALESSGQTLDTIVNTHHHPDHVGGNLELAKRYSSHVYCSHVDLPRVPGATRGLHDGEWVEFDDIRFQILAIPGHTQGQIALFFPEGVLTAEGKAPAVFAGDTLFAMGCGRLFEGSPEQMWTSLNRLMKLPSDTRLYFGHEYTERNAAFAKTIEPQNTEEIEKRLQAARAFIAQGRPVPPPTLAEERRVNPFLRAGDLEIFTRRRAARDLFT